MSFAVCVRFFKLVLGDPLHGFVLQLSHAPISEPSVYQKHLGVEVRFNQEHDVITFPSHLLNQTLKQRSDAPLTAAQRRVSGQLYSNNVPLLERLNLLIKLTLGGSSISIIPVARLLGVHPRTLQRRLAEQGVNYRELVLSIRMQQASWYLQFSDIDITLLGHALGYQDGANFTRAFKRFLGCSPRQWR